jgi:protein translocase SecG subunit
MDLSRWVDSILTGLFVLTGGIMTFFILLQEGKGGGLTALGGTKAAGVEGVTNPIRRATVYMAILFFSLAAILGILHRPKAATKIGAGSSTPAAATTEASASMPPKTVNAAEPKKVEVEAKKEEAKTVTEPKKDEAKKAEEAKTEDTKKVEEPKKDETKKVEEPKKIEEPKKEETKKAD